MRFIFGLIHNPPASAPVTDFTRFYDEIVRLVAAAVDEGVADHVFAPAPTEVRMLLFMGALGEALCGWVIAGRPELTPELADAIVDTLVRGWKP
jgi:hypothetical protein